MNRRTWLSGTARLAALTAAGALSWRAGADTEDPDMAARIANDLQGWDAIDDHRTGTAGDTRTARWLIDQVRAAGVHGEVDAFPFARRVPGDCFVTDGRSRAEGVPLFDGGATEADGVSGAAGDLAGDAAIGIGPFGPYDGHPGTQALHRARAQNRHLALVAFAAGDAVAPGLTLLNADRFGAPFGPPVLQVATEHAAWLQAAAAAGTRLTVAAPLTVEETRASNVQVRIDGTQPGLAPLVVMTPRSAWWTCTAERGGGIVVWLEAVRRLAAAPPERTVIFTANTGHELGHVGLKRFLAANPTLVGGAHAWVHLGANFAAAAGETRFQASDEALLELGLTALASHGVPADAVTPVGERPLGEARDVFDGNGRYVSLLGSNRLFHHPDDRWPHAVDLDKTVRATRAMLQVIDRLSRA